MKVGDRHFRSIWYETGAGGEAGGGGGEVRIIDQRWLPHEFRVVALKTRDDFIAAIRDMWVRGAPLIGATAAHAIAEEMKRDASDANLDASIGALLATRPTAVNLRWALDGMRALLAPLAETARAGAAHARALQICEDDVETNRQIGLHGLEIIREIAKNKGPGEPVNILTHCNAGWLATVDWGTATSPMYHADAAGIAIHVWVDETRPRNQGALLTSWEMAGHGIAHHLIADNAGGHLMQHGEVDLVLVGTDRTTAHGDVANKIGTYLKALAAADNGVPFYVALPSPTIDWTLQDGISDIPIEARDGREVTHVQGKLADGTISEVQISPDATRGANPAFDVTPRRLITGLITERGICPASPEGLARLFPEHAGKSQAQDPSSPTPASG